MEFDREKIIENAALNKQLKHQKDVSKETNKETNKDVSKDVSKETDKETDKETNKETDKIIPEPVLKVENFKNFIKLYEEDGGGGCANATLGNTSGMGDVSAPIVSSTPGDVAGSIAGSGDLPAYDNPLTFSTNNLTKGKKKKKKKTLKKFTDWTNKK